MDKLIAANSVNNAGRPAVPSSGTPQYATDGPPGTTIEAYHYNGIIDEILGVITAAGLTPDKNNNGQMATAIATLIAAAASISAPTGMVQMFAANAAPSMWLECNGASLLRASFPALFAVIGTSWGSVDGTHFTLPDFRGEFPRGWDHGRGLDPARAFASAQADAFKSHTHDLVFGNSNSGQSVPGHGDTGVNTTTTVATGGSETRPVNLALMFCIKT